MIAVAIAIREIAGHQEKRRAAQDRRHALLRQAPIRVKDTDPFRIGVTSSEIANRYRGAAGTPPYVPRDIDSKLDYLLRNKPFVAVVGPSKAGKSRTAFEAVFRSHPERTLIAPDLPGSDPEGISEVLAHCVDQADEQGVIIWLDDLQEFLRTRSLGNHDINAWRAAHPKVVVVATIRDSELESLRRTGRDTDVEKAIEQAEIVPLPPLLSEQEASAAKNAYPQEDFRDGIGVHLVAGPQLVQRYVAARESNPVAFALMAAAVDRKRAGVFRPASEGELAELAPVYFRELRPRSQLLSADLAPALAWAGEPVIQDIGVLLRDENGGIEPFEYITAFRDGEVAEGVGMALIPDKVWMALLDSEKGATLRSVGDSARLRGRFEIACKAYEKLSRDSDPHMAAHGIDDLGAVLNAMGNRSSSVRQLRSLVDSKFPCVRASACYRLAGIIDRDAFHERESLYRIVLENPDSWAYPKAAVNLGLLLRSKTSVESVQADRATLFAVEASKTEGDQQLESEARELFEQAMASNDREAIGFGANALGVLLCSRGEMEAGEEAFARGIEVNCLQAFVSLALTIFAQPGREAEAWQLLDQAQGLRGQEEERGIDYLHLSAGIVARARGDVEEAAARFRLVVERENEPYRSDASIRLARLLLSEGEEAEAIELLEENIDLKTSEAEKAEEILNTIRSG
ncbi:MAG TPA: hypothetical protein VNM38_11200 [Solirubrobacterales bacterium]|nr:hypothetical protein [Solirubrobacterales bacterium]